MTGIKISWSRPAQHVLFCRVFPWVLRLCASFFRDQGINFFQTASGCVTGITLPSVMSNFFFIVFLAAVRGGDGNVGSEGLWCLGIAAGV